MSKMNEEIYCSICNLPLFPITLKRDRNNWCRCNKVGVPDGWSQKEKTINKKQR